MDASNVAQHTTRHRRRFGVLLWAGLYLAIAMALLGANPLRGETTGPFDLLVSYPGWNTGGEAVQVRNGERSDVLDALLPAWMESRRQIRAGIVPLWNPLRAGGSPALFDPTTAQLIMADHPFTSPTATGILINDYHWRDNVMDAVGQCYAVFPSNATGREQIVRSTGRTQIALPPINNRNITQIIRMPRLANVSAVSIKLATYRAKDVDGQITASLRSVGDHGAELARATVPAATVIDNSFLTFVFPAKAWVDSGLYELSFRYLPGPRNKNMTAWLATDVPGLVRAGETDVRGSLQYVVLGAPDGSFDVLAENGGFAVARNTDCIDGAYWATALANPLPSPARREGIVRLERYRPDRFTLQSQASAAGFVIVPMQYQQGWHARVDGQPAKIRLVYGVLPAVAVPAGAAEVIFTYRPDHFWLGLAISIAALLVLAALWALASRPRNRGRHP